MPFGELTPVYPRPSYTGGPKSGCSWGLTNAEWRGIVTPLSLLLSSRTSLAFFADTPCCCLMSTRLPKSFSTELLPHCSACIVAQGSSPHQVQDLAFVPVEFCKVSTVRLNFVRFPTRCADPTGWQFCPWAYRLVPQLGVACKLEKQAVHDLLQVTDKDVKQGRSQDRPLRYSTYYWLPGKARITNYYIWAWSPNQFFTYLVVHSSKQWYLTLDIRILWDTALKALLKLSCCPCIHKCWHSIIEGKQVGQAGGKLTLTLPNHFLLPAFIMSLGKEHDSKPGAW